VGQTFCWGQTTHFKQLADYLQTFRRGAQPAGADALNGPKSLLDREKVQVVDGRENVLRRRLARPIATDSPVNRRPLIAPPRAESKACMN
jgi:hypothetical protein